MGIGDDMKFKAFRHNIFLQINIFLNN